MHIRYFDNVLFWYFYLIEYSWCIIKAAKIRSDKMLIRSWIDYVSQIQNEFMTHMVIQLWKSGGAQKEENSPRYEMVSPIRCSSKNENKLRCLATKRNKYYSVIIIWYSVRCFRCMQSFTKRYFGRIDPQLVSTKRDNKKSLKIKEAKNWKQERPSAKN